MIKWTLGGIASFWLNMPNICKEEAASLWLHTGKRNRWDPSKEFIGLHKVVHVDNDGTMASKNSHVQHCSEHPD